MQSEIIVIYIFHSILLFYKQNLNPTRVLLNVFGLADEHETSRYDYETRSAVRYYFGFR